MAKLILFLILFLVGCAVTESTPALEQAFVSPTYVPTRTAELVTAVPVITLTKPVTTEIPKLTASTPTETITPINKFNTAGQFLGTEPSNQAATEQARLDSPVAVATSLGIEGCANCQFVPTEWGQRLEDPKLGTVAWQVGGKWEAAKDCADPNSLRKADIRNKTGFRAIFNGKMCSSEPITDEIQIKDGLGTVIGKNRLGFVYMYKAPDTGKSAMLFVSLVAEDMDGQLIALDWSKSAMCPGNPLDCYAGKISQKGIGINFYGTREDYDITVQKLKSRNAYPVEGSEEKKTLDFEGNFYVGRSGIPNKIRTGSMSEVLISAGFDSAFYR